MQLAPREQIGLALGAWGAVQATATGLAMALGGLIRQFLDDPLGPSAAYTSVYTLELLMLAATLLAMAPLSRNLAPASEFKQPANPEVQI